MDAIVKLTAQGTDRYGRTLGDTDDKGSAQKAMLRSGHACVYPKFIVEKALVDMQDLARTKRLGLWALPEGIEPQHWRQQMRT
ncbi:MAG: thermonuclease family protein [Burkholderiales bacterium]|nr:thermonuclease family protein [Burkholderiales bacterium]